METLWHYYIYVVVWMVSFVDFVSMKKSPHYLFPAPKDYGTNIDKC